MGKTQYKIEGVKDSALPMYVFILVKHYQFNQYNDRSNLEGLSNFIVIRIIITINPNTIMQHKHNNCDEVNNNTSHRIMSLVIVFSIAQCDYLVPNIYTEIIKPPNRASKEKEMKNHN